MNALVGIAIIAYLAAFAFAVYERLPISDWLAGQPLADSLPGSTASRLGIVWIGGEYRGHQQQHQPREYGGVSGRIR